MNRGTAKKLESLLFWKEFCKTAITLPPREKLLSFEPGRKLARSLGFRNMNDYRKNRPKCLPSVPSKTYRGKGYIDGPDFLGTKTTLQFEEARKLARSLGFRTIRDYRKNRPKCLPHVPSKVYRGKGWIDTPDYLGSVKRRKRSNFLPFEEARKLVRSWKCKNTKDFLAYLRREKIQNIPTGPKEVYGCKWISWYDFLGIAIPATRLALGVGQKINVNLIRLLSEPKTAPKLASELGLKSWSSLSRRLLVLAQKGILERSYSSPMGKSRKTGGHGYVYQISERFEYLMRLVNE